MGGVLKEKNSSLYVIYPQPRFSKCVSRSDALRTKKIYPSPYMTQVRGKEKVLPWSKGRHAPWAYIRGRERRPEPLYKLRACRGIRYLYLKLPAAVSSARLPVLLSCKFSSRKLPAAGSVAVTQRTLTLRTVSLPKCGLSAGSVKVKGMGA